MQSPEPGQSGLWHGTTILTVRKGGVVAVGGDGQVTIGQTIVKANAKKVRRLGKGDVIGGFAGATADAFTLFERLESKLEQYPGQLTRAAVELAKDWRTDRYLRRLEAMMIVADKEVSLVLTGTGDVLEPEAGIVGIGSGGNYALAAARALTDGPLSIKKMFCYIFVSIRLNRQIDSILKELNDIMRRFILFKENKNSLNHTEF